MLIRINRTNHNQPYSVSEKRLKEVICWHFRGHVMPSLIGGSSACMALVYRNC